MRKRKNLFRALPQTLAIFLVLLTACDGKDDPEPTPQTKEYSLAVTPAEVNFSNAAGQTATLTVTANDKWTVKASNNQWVTISPDSGTSGTVTVTVSVQANATYEDRSTTLTFTCGNKTAQTTIKQQTGTGLFFNADSLYFSYEGETKTVTLQKNVNYTLSKSPETATWFQVTSTKAIETQTLTIEAAPNKELESRTAYLVISNEDATLKDTLVVTQQAYQLSDRDYLMALYKSTNGDQWTHNDGWGTDAPLTEWYGIAVDKKGNCIRIDLYQNNLTGTLPPELSKLSYATNFGFGRNHISGDIPGSYGEMPALVELFLASNELSGTIPANLARIPRLMLYQNNLTGSIPEAFGAYNNFYCLTENRLTGSIPRSIVQNPNWINICKEIINQQKGYGFDITGVPLPAQQYVAKDLDNKVVDFGQIYKDNKYTVFLFWSSTCVFSNALMPQLVDFYKEYHHLGLEVIASNAVDDGTQYIRNWIKENGYDVFINIPYNEYDNNLALKSYPSLTPAATVVDSLGNTIFTWSGNRSKADPEDRLGRTASSELIPFLKEKMGITPKEFYQSKDYSADGQVLTLQKATEGNGVNIVLLGDGFADKDMATGGLFEQRMETAMEELFTEEPFKSFRNRFNIYAVKAVSQNDAFETGAHTAFDCYFGQDQFVGGNKEKCFEYALKVPGITSRKDLTIAVVLNSPRISGTCHMLATDNASVSFVPYIAGNATYFGQTLRHEVVGHGFGFLGDEYTYTQSITQDLAAMYQEQYQKQGWWANVDFTNDPATIKWAAFLADSRYKGQVGIYEGGLTYNKGVYRSTEFSIMRENTGGFNAPSRLAIYKRLMERSGEQYSFEQFLSYDAINRGTATEGSSVIRATAVGATDQKVAPMMHAPVVHK